MLVDPIPEVRSVAARALGQIVSGLGETSFPELVAWLVGMLKTAAGNVERSGAAQGLSEVLGHLGVDRFDSVLVRHFFFGGGVAWRPWGANVAVVTPFPVVV